MTAKELININDEVKRMILNHMEQNNLTLNQIAYRCKIHQSQLWMYIYSNDKKGIHSKSIERIGEYLEKFNQEKK